MAGVAHAEIPGRITGLDITVKIYEHPGPLHHEYTQHFSITEDDPPGAPSTIEREMKFNIGHRIPYVDRFYNNGKYDLKRSADIVQGTGAAVAYSYNVLNADFGGGRGPRWTANFGTSTTSGSYYQSSFGPTASFARCIWPGTRTRHISDAATGWVEKLVGYTVMHQWSPTSNESSYLELYCRWTSVADNVRPAYMRFSPSIVNLRGVSGGVSITGNTTLEIGPISTGTVTGRLIATTPTGVSLTRDGYAPGGGFNNDPITVSTSGVSVPVRIEISDTTEGVRTYSAPVSLEYQ